MDKRGELHQRIVKGSRNLTQLKKLVDEVPHGARREGLGAKVIRMQQSLNALEDGFIELYPGVCLFADRKCESSNKGTFHCTFCREYLNILYSTIDKQRLL